MIKAHVNAKQTPSSNIESPTSVFTEGLQHRPSYTGHATLIQGYLLSIELSYIIELLITWYQLMNYLQKLCEDLQLVY